MIAGITHDSILVQVFIQAVFSPIVDVLIRNVRCFTADMVGRCDAVVFIDPTLDFGAGRRGHFNPFNIKSSDG